MANVNFVNALQKRKRRDNKHSQFFGGACMCALLLSPREGKHTGSPLLRNWNSLSIGRSSKLEGVNSISQQDKELKQEIARKREGTYVLMSSRSTWSSALFHCLVPSSWALAAFLAFFLGPTASRSSSSPAGSQQPTNNQREPKRERGEVSDQGEHAYSRPGGSGRGPATGR